MSLSYTGLHWGTIPNRTSNLHAYVGPATSVGAIKAISYVTQKDDGPDIYRHVFGSPTPRLLNADSTGELRAPKVPDKTIELGRLIDIELIDNTRVILGLTRVVTSKSGSHIWLVSSQKVPFAIEHDSNSVPAVTEAGIVA